MLAQTHQEVFLRSFFAKKRPLAPQRIGVFFVSFLLRLLCQKKAGRRFMPYKIAVSLQK
jgi:hypothetical protein